MQRFLRSAVPYAPAAAAPGGLLFSDHRGETGGALFRQAAQIVIGRTGDGKDVQLGSAPNALPLSDGLPFPLLERRAQPNAHSSIRSERSSAVAECVIAPTLMKSTPVSATRRTRSSVMLPDASISIPEARLRTCCTASRI